MIMTSERFHDGHCLEHATTTLARDTMSRIFDNYRWFRDNAGKPAPAGIAYDTLGGAQVSTHSRENTRTMSWTEEV